MIKQLIIENRSTRRFIESQSVPEQSLKDWIDLARICPSARNAQPLKYIYSNDHATNDSIFPLLQWAGYLEDWDGPAEGERPAAYIIVLGDTSISRNFECDAGIAMQSILLAAREAGYAGCIIGSIDRPGMRKSLKIKSEFMILYVLALGLPGEEIKIEKTGEDGDIRYWRDSHGVHHVPKRSLREILLHL